MIRVRLSGGAFFFGKVNSIVELTPFKRGVFSFGNTFTVNGIFLNILSDGHLLTLALYHADDC